MLGTNKSNGAEESLQLSAIEGFPIIFLIGDRESKTYIETLRLHQVGQAPHVLPGSVQRVYSLFPPPAAAFPFRGRSFLRTRFTTGRFRNGGGVVRLFGFSLDGAESRGGGR